LYVRISKGKKLENIPNYEQRLDITMLKNILNDSLNVKMAYVCGSPQMNYDVSKALYSILRKDQVHIM
jgi:hypothetical protein